MGERLSEGQFYLTMYPHFHRWMNVCIACHHQGYKPEMPPNDDPLFRGQNLRRYFLPLALDGDGLCEQCSAAFRGSPRIVTQEQRDA